MLTSWTEQAWDDYLHWQEHDPEMLERINTLIRDTKRDFFRGLGKPEPLKGDLAGHWARRITKEHRLVYKPSKDALVITACRFHYEKKASNR